MATFIDEKKVETIEKLALDAELLIEQDDERKDRKEKRGIIKQTFYSGPHTMRHMIPRGKHV